MGPMVLSAGLRHSGHWEDSLPFCCSAQGPGNPLCAQVLFRGIPRREFWNPTPVGRRAYFTEEGSEVGGAERWDTSLSLNPGKRHQSDSQGDSIPAS